MARHIKLLAALFAGISALAATYVVAGRIEPLLPAEGASTCFQGTYDGSTGLTFGFPHEKRTDVAHITKFVLRLDLEPGQEPLGADPSVYTYDWRYDFRLAAETSDKGDFKSAAQCDWTDGAISRVVPSLYCFIDCDGGGIELRRLPARNAIELVWSADGWLRMSACGGGGEILRGGATTKTFRLDRAPDEVCKDMPLVSY